MPGAWESLIPGTTSTEPLTLPQSPDEPIGVVVCPPTPRMNYFRNQNPPQEEIGGAYDGVKEDATCDNNNFIRSSPTSDPYDTTESNHRPPHQSPPTNRNRINEIENENGNEKGRDSFHRLTSSIHCADQFWRFYSDRFEGRRAKDYGGDGDSPKRCFLKTGVYNTRTVNVFERTRRYVRDIFTTLVDSKWRWTLLVFTFSYIISWLGFALLWFLILLYHGDLEPVTPTDYQPCVAGVKSFASIFLFSLETQHTIGYGTRYIQDNCPDAILLLILQSITGILIEAFVVGVVFAKVSRPKKRSQTLVFSKNAVICQRDEKNYLMVRVGDLRNRSSLFEAHVRAQVITKRLTKEGELIPIHQQEIKVGGYGEDEDRLLLFWPTIVVHPIEPDSPFYAMSASDLSQSSLELIVVLEGVVESTGMTTQLRTSYLPQEILWGRRFRELSSHKNETGRHVFDFELFNDTFPLDQFPLCSAQDLDHFRQLKSQSQSSPHTGIIIDDCGMNESHPQQQQLQHQRRNNIELTIMNGMGQVRRASIDSYDDYQDHNQRTGHAHPHSDNSNSSGDESSEDSDGRKVCYLGLPGAGKKRIRERSSTCTTSTNLSDSNV